MGIKIKSNNSQIKTKMKSIYKSNSTQFLASLMIVCVMGMSLATDYNDLESKLGQWINNEQDQKLIKPPSRILSSTEVKAPETMSAKEGKTPEIIEAENALDAMYKNQYELQFTMATCDYYVNLYYKCIELNPYNQTCMDKLSTQMTTRQDAYFSEKILVDSIAAKQAKLTKLYSDNKVPEKSQRFGSDYFQN